MEQSLSNFVDGQRLYIIEYDDNVERMEDWRAKNIPTSAIMTSRMEFEKNVVIELWKELPQ